MFRQLPGWVQLSVTLMAGYSIYLLILWTTHEALLLLASGIEGIIVIVFAPPLVYLILALTPIIWAIRQRQWPLLIGLLLAGVVGLLTTNRLLELMAGW